MSQEFWEMRGTDRGITTWRRRVKGGWLYRVTVDATGFSAQPYFMPEEEPRAAYDEAATMDPVPSLGRFLATGHEGKA